MHDVWQVSFQGSHSPALLGPGPVLFEHCHMQVNWSARSVESAVRILGLKYVLQWQDWKYRAG